MRTRVSYEEYFRDALEIDFLKQNNPGEWETLDGILDLIVDTCCANKPWILISGDKKPIEVVKSRFMKLNSSHIEYVLKCLSDNTTRIRNVNQYLLATLFNAMSRESILKQYLEPLKKEYDFIILDCMPSLGMLTVNALAASDQLIVPVQAQYLSAKGLEQLLQTVNKVKRQINPKLRIEGILLTMVDSRTNNAKEIAGLIRETYGSRLKVFDVEIPRSVRAAEISAEGKSIFAHDPGGKVAAAYKELTKEVIRDAEKRHKHQLEQLR